MNRSGRRAKLAFALAVLGLQASGIARAELPPVIERVQPSAGPPGTLLRITGRRLRGETRVQIGATQLPVELSTPNLVTARVPEGIASGAVSVVTAYGTVAGPEFQVTSHPGQPSISRIAPLRAAVGASVTIEGQHFSLRLAENSVQFGSAAAIVESATPRSLRVVVPEAASSGPVTVHVANAGEARSTAAFEVVRRLSLKAVLPPSAAGGAQLELQGTGFSAQREANRVLLGRTPLRVLAATPTSLTVQLPANASGSMLRVEVPGAGSATAAFEVLTAPTITSFAPTASALPAEIVVTGTGFGREPGGLSAHLGATPLNVVRVAPTELVLAIPAGAGSGKIAVERSGLGRAESKGAFTVTGALSLRDPRPASGPVGSEIAIEGTGFGLQPSEQRVSFGGAPAEVMAVADGRLSLRVPEGAKSGPIMVQIGANRAQTPHPFVVTSPPKIARVSAEELTAGSELTLFGAGFGQQPALVHVALAAQALEVVSVRDDAIVVRAPNAALRGELSVHVALQGRAVYARPVRVTAAR